jgi:hypothetical protein
MYPSAEVYSIAAGQDAFSACKSDGNHVHTAFATQLDPIECYHRFVTTSAVSDDM